MFGRTRRQVGLELPSQDQGIRCSTMTIAVAPAFAAEIMLPVRLRPRSTEKNLLRGCKRMFARLRTRSRIIASEKSRDVQTVFHFFLNFPLAMKHVER